MNIVEFLKARISEDEAQAERCRYDGSSGPASLFSADRALAECATKRALMKWVSEWPLRPHAPSSVYGILETLATTYASHPDYSEEWVLRDPQWMQ